MTVKVPNLVQMRLISYRIKMELSCLWQNFGMPVSHIHTFFYLLRQDSVQLKKLKGNVDLPNYKIIIS